VFDQVTDKLSAFKKETFRMEKEIGLREKKRKKGHDA